MARTRTLSELISTIRLRADAVGQTDRWTDADIIDRINASYSELWDEILSARGHEHYMLMFDITTVANTDTYALATDFYEMLAVKWVIQNELLDLNTINLSDLTGKQVDVWPNERRPRWRVVGSNASTNVSQILFDPIPSASGNTIRTYYVPHAPQYATNGSDNTKIINGWNGYENFVEWDVAAQMIEEEERDSSNAVRRREEVRARVQAMAPHRNAGGPEFIHDVRRRRGTYAWGTW